MKKIYKDKIINVENTDLFDNSFLFDCLDIDYNNPDIEVIYLSDLLEKRKNPKILEKVIEKPAMYSNVYSPEDELEIFKDLYNYAITNNKKIHIIGVTLDEEIKILEEYYENIGFMRQDINCFEVDFSKPLITVSVKIENLIWKGSDYKSQREKIFFNPPIRESGQVKAMFKGINRGVIAGIHIGDFNDKVQEFLGKCVSEENILSLTLGKVLIYNLEQAGFKGLKKQLIISY